MIFRYLWLIILGLGYIIWTIKSLSDGIRAFKRIRYYSKKEKKPFWKYTLLDWSDDYGVEFLYWLIINGTILFLSSLWYFIVESC